MSWDKIYLNIRTLAILAIGMVAGHYEGTANTLLKNIVNQDKVYCVRPTENIKG